MKSRASRIQRVHNAWLYKWFRIEYTYCSFFRMKKTHISVSGNRTRMASIPGQNVHLVVSSCHLVVSSCHLVVSSLISSFRPVILPFCCVISSFRRVIWSSRSVISSSRPVISSSRRLAASPIGTLSNEDGDADDEGKEQ